MVDQLSNPQRGHDDLMVAHYAITRALRDLCPTRELSRDAFDAIVDALQSVDEVLGAGPSTTCPTCGWTSYDRHDITVEYCPQCHFFYNKKGLRRA